MWVDASKFSVDYWPGDSKSGMFGGNSNWRGPIWLAVNFLLIESLQRFHQYYGSDFQVSFFACLTSVLYPDLFPTCARLNAQLARETSWT